MLPAAWHVVARLWPPLSATRWRATLGAMILVCTVVLPGRTLPDGALFSDNKLVVLRRVAVLGERFAGFRGALWCTTHSFRTAPFAMIPAAPLACHSARLCQQRRLAEVCNGLPRRTAAWWPLRPAPSQWAFTLGVWSVLFAVSYLWGREAGASRRGKTAAVVLHVVACGAWAAVPCATPLQGVYHLLVEVGTPAT